MSAEHTRAHPKLSINALAFGDHGLRAAVEHAGRSGVPLSVHRVALEHLGWDSAVGSLGAAGPEISYVMHSAVVSLEQPAAWGEEGRVFLRTLDAAVELGARQVCITSGAAGRLSWEEAAERLTEALEPLLAEAADRGVDVVIEPTGQLRQDIGFVHTLRDTVELARRTGCGVCLDSFWCFRERDLFPTIREAADLIRLVQITDNPAGKVEHGDRMVPGDGIADLAGILRVLGAAGYGGWLDLEILGPRIAEEGPPDAVDRGLAHVRDILAEVAA